MLFTFLWTLMCLYRQTYIKLSNNSLKYIIIIYEQEKLKILKQNNK